MPQIDHLIGNGFECSSSLRCCRGFGFVAPHRLPDSHGLKMARGHGTPSLGTAFIPTSLTWKTERVSPSSHMNRFCAPTPSSVLAHACCYSLVRSHSFAKARRHHHARGVGHPICGRSRSRSSLPLPFPLPSPSRGADLSRRYPEAIDRFALTEPQACTRSRFAVQTIRGLTIMTHQS